MHPRSLIVVISITLAIVACAPSRPHGPVGVTFTVDCPPAVPDSLPRSVLRRSLGSSDLTLSPQTGALFVEIRGDESNPKVFGAQVSLRSRATQRDTVVTDSVVSVTRLPAGRYSLQVKRIGFRQLQDSIEIRTGYLDTVRVSLATDMICLESRVQPAE